MTDLSNPLKVDGDSDFTAFEEFRLASAAYDGSDGDDDEANRLRETKDAALQKFLFTPTDVPWLLEEKFRLFERFCLDEDGRSHTDNRELKFFACLKADALSIAQALFRKSIFESK